MPVNKVIHDRRKELGFTQEQIAENLGVSAPAVNKWEKGNSYPDITLLPALARLLETDLNTLLCFQEELSEQEIRKFTAQLLETLHKNGLAEGTATALRLVREYPNCGKLIQNMATSLDSALVMSGLGDGEKKPYEEQIIGLYRRTAECKEEGIRERALFMLASKYLNRGDYNEAQEMLDRLPERSALDKKQVQARLYMMQGKLNDAAKQLESKLYMSVNEIQNTLLMMADLTQKEGNSEGAAEIANIASRAAELFGLWDYYRYLAPLEVAVARQDVTESLELLHNILACAESPWNPGQVLLYHHIYQDSTKEAEKKTAEKKEAAGKKAAELMIPPLLAELEENNKYEFLYDEKAFRQLISRYRDKYGPRP